MNYKTFFKGKRIAVVGLGPHGEMVTDIKFLLRSGAIVSVFDIRSEARLQGASLQLREVGFSGIVFEKFPEEELTNVDIVLLSPEISRKSLFLKKATQARVQIEYPETLLLKLATPFTLLGVIGEAGKSTVAHMLYSVLKQSFADYKDQGLYFIDPELSYGALSHLKKLKNGDIVLVRITEDMATEYAHARVSPHVAIITSLPHNCRNILKLIEHQTYNNFIVAPDGVVDVLKGQSGYHSKAKVLRTRHENHAIVSQAAELFKVQPEAVQSMLSNFQGLKAHQELVKKIGGIEFYNDSASVTPASTIYALRRLGGNKNVILILGGAYTGAHYTELIMTIPEYVATVILLPGSGSLGIRGLLEVMKGVMFIQALSLDDAVKKARENAKKGDKVIFSPGFQAVGIHVSRKERGDKFVKAVREL